MAALDWVFVAVLLASFLLGAWRGLVRELMALAGWVAAFVLAQWFGAEAGQWLPMGQASGTVRYVAGFLAVFMATLVVASLLGWVVRKLLESVGLGPLDRLLGALFGLVRGVVVVLVVAVVFELTPLRSTALWTESAGAHVASAALRGLQPVLPDAFRQYLPG